MSFPTNPTHGQVYYNALGTKYQWDASRLTTGAWLIGGIDSSVISGVGTAGFIPQFIDYGTIANSIVQTDGTNVGIGTTPSGNYVLEVNGYTKVGYQFYIGNNGRLGDQNGELEISSVANQLKFLGGPNGTVVSGYFGSDKLSSTDFGVGGNIVAFNGLSVGTDWTCFNYAYGVPTILDPAVKLQVIGDASIVGKMTVSGSFSVPMTPEQTSNYNVTDNDHTILLNDASFTSDATAFLPDATTCLGRIYCFHFEHSAGTNSWKIIPSAGNTIENDASLSYGPILDWAAIGALTIQSDGTSDWKILNATIIVVSP